MGNVGEALFLLASLIAIPEEERKSFLKVPLVSRKQTYLFFVHVVGCKKHIVAFFLLTFTPKQHILRYLQGQGDWCTEKYITRIVRQKCIYFQNKKGQQHLFSHKHVCPSSFRGILSILIICKVGKESILTLFFCCRRRGASRINFHNNPRSTLRFTIYFSFVF